ncbi:hypothetical protein [Sulfitobacter sp. PS-8MA]|uniref:hypothetical protein n=1 Tax=Sulfitobacter sp. PS-8MA TaxID=3237707 RepID=UPI0034C688FA
MQDKIFSWFKCKTCEFGRDEDGGILILSLLLFVCMTVAGGLAVDLANHERTRTLFQSHLDNAVLSAASLTQNLGAKQTVMSYMSSAGLDTSGIKVRTSTEKIGGVIVGRTVSASLQQDVRTYFFRFFGHDGLGMTIESQATERVEDIEISLVLDVSGSMKDPVSGGSRRKIEALKDAASGFVDEILSEAEEGRVSISVIPYSTKVNAGKLLLDQYNTTREHSYSHCVDFEADDFQILSINPSKRLQRTGHFQQNGSYYSQSYGEWTCRIDPGFAITPLSSSTNDLKVQINSLRPEGSTSIDVGAKWGLALLDPSARRPVSNLVSEGVINSAFLGRPHPHNAENSMKILVIMTDGDNRPEYRLRPEFASGKSDVIKFTNRWNGRTYYNVESVEKSDANDDSWPHNETYFYASYPTNEDYYRRIWDNDVLNENKNLSESARKNLKREDLTWPKLWNEMSPFYYGYNLVGRQRNSDSHWVRDSERRRQWDEMIEEIGSYEKDMRLRAICNTAHKAGIVTYTIGMEVEDDDSLDLLKDCASTEAHYFDVDGMEIKTAFEMIAASISMLRLTK